MADEKRTGKRPQKSSQEPQPHHKESPGGGTQTGTQTMESEERAEEERAGEKSSENDDLKKREYRDEKGEIHHHTRIYQEHHKGEHDKEKSSR